MSSFDPVAVPAGAVLVEAGDLLVLVSIVAQCHDVLLRSGRVVHPEIKNILDKLSSVAGTSELVDSPVEDHVVYEQIDTKTAADILGYSDRYVRELASTGRIPGDFRGGRWVFSRDDVEVYRDFK